MAKKFIIYTGTVQATYRNGQAASGVSDMDKVEFKSVASTPGSLSIYIKVPLQIMQNLRYELFLVDDELKENLSGIFSSPNLGWNPSQPVEAKQYQWADSSSSRTIYNSSVGSYVSDMSTNANMKSGYSLPTEGVAIIRWAQTFAFATDDTNYDTMAELADDEHIFTDEEVWFQTYASSLGKSILSRKSFPEMIDPIDPYQEWWIKDGTLPIRFNFPKMYEYKQVDSNIFEGDNKIKDFYVGDDKVLAIYLGDTKVMG